LIFYIRDRFGYGFVVGIYTPVPPPCFKIGENPNTYSNPVKAEKTCQIGFGSDGYRLVWVLLSYLTSMCI